MKLINRNFFLALHLLIVFFASIAAAITDEMMSVVKFETKANAVATRSDQRVLLEHYEIPLSLLTADVAERTPPEYVASLIFKKGGQDYVRWIVNPEDKKWHLKVEEFLKSKGLDAKRYRYFEGYQTASRSYIVVDPKSKAEFSIKVSTDNTGGHWVDKKQTWEDAKQIRQVTDFVMERLKTQPALEHAILLDEPLAFGIKELDQGMILRSYEGMSQKGNIYVPGFSIMHENIGSVMATKNGAHNPGAYWNDHYNKPLAKALAEFLVVSGMTYDSPHSQNFMVEVNAKGQPTGKIVLRDFGDTYVLEPFFQAQGRADIARNWEKDNIVRDALPVSVGILHGNKAPSWMNMELDVEAMLKRNNYHRWGVDFHEEFSKQMYRQTGIKFPKAQPRPSGLYIQSRLQFDDNAGLEFLEAASRNQHRSLGGACEKVFAIH